MVQATEHQAMAIGRLDGPVCISAGAGSGKTWVLSQRFARALEPGVLEPTPGIADLLAITFTERAAGELSERVRRTLVAARQLDDSRRVDEAWIGTIHGFCARLLRRHALQMGLDPGFRVFNDVEAAVLRERTAESVLRERATTDSECRALLGEYGWGTVSDALLAAYGRVRGTGADPAAVRPALAVAVARELEGLLAAAHGALTAADEELRVCGSSGANYEKCVAGAQTAAREIAAIGEVHGVLPDVERARSLWALLATTKLPANPAGAAKPIVAELNGRLRTVRERALEIVLAPHAGQFAALLGDYHARFTEAKSARGVLDYDDLQILARDLLTSDPAVAQAYRERFGLVMIDEFQDTDELQSSIVSLVSGPRVCTVGDDKQSIYGFRNADVEVFRRHVERMVSNGALSVTLADNFRSSAEVLDLVNDVFSRAFTDDGFTPLKHRRDESAIRRWPSHLPRLQAIFVDDSVGNVDAVAKAEARAIARAVDALVRGGVPESDVVVLMRSLKHMRPYADALQALGMRVAVAGGGDFFGRPEVGWYLALLAIVANLRDDRAVVALAASPLGRIGDDTLLRARSLVRDAGADAGLGMFEAIQEAARGDEDSASVARLAAAVGAAREDTGSEALSTVLLGALERLDGDILFLSSGVEGEQAYANLLKLARMADRFEAEGGSGVASFLEYLKLKREIGDPEPPAAFMDESGGAVRFMTVHAAKGLEFPVVVLPALGREGRGSSSPLSVEKTPTGPTVFASLPGQGKAEMRRPQVLREALDAAAVRDAGESSRVFYVACTRAEEALILAGGTAFAKEAGDRVAIDLVRHGLGLGSAVPREPHACELTTGTSVRVTTVASADVDGGGSAVSGTPGVPPVALRPEPTRAAGPEGEPAPGTAYERSRPAERQFDVPEELSFSRLASFADCRLSFLLGTMARVGAPPEDDRGARGFGDAVHAVLSLATGGQLPAGARMEAIASGHDLDDEARTALEEAAQAFLRSRLANEVEALPSVRREVPFVVPLGDRHTLRGSIDLLGRGDGSAVVVDYKTGSGKREATLEELVEAYRLQAECYALPLLREGLDSVHAAFVLVTLPDEGGEPRTVRTEFTQEDLPAIEHRLETLVTAIDAGPYPHRGHYTPACDHCPGVGSLCPVQVPGRRRSPARSRERGPRQPY